MIYNRLPHIHQPCLTLLWQATHRVRAVKNKLRISVFVMSQNHIQSTVFAVLSSRTASFLKYVSVLYSFVFGRYVGSDRAATRRLILEKLYVWTKIYNQLFPLFQIYLSQFGYLPPSARNPSNGGLLDSNTWSKAIMDFQGFAGVNVTGN